MVAQAIAVMVLQALNPIVVRLFILALPPVTLSGMWSFEQSPTHAHDDSGRTLL
jgi:hypothetical protein